MIERAKLADFAYDLDEKLAPWSGERTWEWVGSADVRGDLSWEFDEVAVYRHHETGQLVIAHDSGCSCPSPFEDTTLRDATFIHRLKDYDDFVDEYESKERGVYDEVRGVYVELDEPRRHPSVVDQVTRLRNTVETHLKETR